MSDLVNNSSYNDVDFQIVQQCAPVILGIKPANLLILNESEYTDAKKLFQDSDLSLYHLCTFESKNYSLLYQPHKVEKCIQQQLSYSYLSQLGYHPQQMDIMIQIIAYKYSRYLYEKKSFPHEIGLLLGYPAGDVLKFINNRGAHYIYSGYWKVYDNLPEALLVFWRYHKAKEILNQLIQRGGSLSAVVHDVILYRT